MTVPLPVPLVLVAPLLAPPLACLAAFASAAAARAAALDSSSFFALVLSFFAFFLAEAVSPDKAEVEEWRSSVGGAWSCRLAPLAS